MWSRKPHLMRLAPEWCRQDHAVQEALRIGLADPQCAETSVCSRESRSSCRRPEVPEGRPATVARLIAKLCKADPLTCRRCSSPMGVMAVITEPQQVRKILLRLGASSFTPGSCRWSNLSPCRANQPANWGAMTCSSSIKVNSQWDERGGTNSDLIRAIIDSIVRRRDGSAGRS
jgi:hypothetical protein